MEEHEGRFRTAFGLYGLAYGIIALSFLLGRYLHYGNASAVVPLLFQVAALVCAFSGLVIICLGMKARDIPILIAAIILLPAIPLSFLICQFLSASWQ